MRPVLIGLHGVKRAGKNTTADFIEEIAAGFDPALSVRQRGFADKAKWAYARQWFPGITMDDAIAWFDAYKDDPEYEAVLWQHDAGITIREKRAQIRQHMAQFSTDSARDIYGFDFWVDQLLPLARTFNEHDLPVGSRWYDSFLIDLGNDVDMQIRAADLCVITDVRFENEVERIKTLGGSAIKIKRRDAEQAVIEEACRQNRDVHRSELGLPDELFDYVIDNSDNDMKEAKRRTYRVLWSIIFKEAQA